MKKDLNDSQSPLEAFIDFCKNSYGKVFNYKVKVLDKEVKPHLCFIVSTEQKGEKFLLHSTESLSVITLIPKFNKHREALNISWLEITLLAYAINNNLPGLWVHSHVFLGFERDTIIFTSSSLMGYDENELANAAILPGCIEAAGEAFPFLADAPEYKLVMKFPANEYYEKLLPLSRRYKRFIKISDYR